MERKRGADHSNDDGNGFQTLSVNVTIDRDSEIPVIRKGSKDYYIPFIPVIHDEQDGVVTALLVLNSPTLQKKPHKMEIGSETAPLFMSSEVFS